ncbi:aminotransferase class I/II-fold pyridoxal phosphate-dependent enzyme [Phaeovibrio sulfidiphilus]|uniref:Aminotransferase class I/II-fold pyridoxal phosphate-dependent enzyme n=1 Tax=Phaeovibrio sulfidiphilus TaxID=1220600 RepID=A0A8J6YX07_9PROT|nr:aminotransferase class I/II-fold pyridoxal phosphate-dependent enzyme [Phaeovibrio sulfidiphilus]MBE1236248.1 aminotransferase class I/II-fold pyridoxal phosphate-dependent enzyme [Phaeovibrio sulfidiphilus]
MIPDPLAQLPDYPFARLRTLLGDTPPGKPPVDLSLGEPQHAPPAFLTEVLDRNADGWRAYPPVAGTPEWKAAVCGWLARRYDLPEGMVDPAAVLPASGTREALFALGQLLLPAGLAGTGGADGTGGTARAPLVIMPDPAYLPYLGAAVLNGATPWPVPWSRTAATGGFPSLPDTVWEQARMAYICSPSNPQGTLVSREGWRRLVEKARATDTILIADECYSEIYDREAPAGVLEAVRDLGGSLKNVLVLNSLSKRSNAAGLRSGFIAGDPDLVAAFARMRAYGAAGMPRPVQAASAALWNDETHVEENRALYRRKFDLAEKILGHRPGFRRPEGGFFLWFDATGLGPSSEAVALRLWAEQGVKVLPAQYMMVGSDSLPEDRMRLRIALVATEDRLGEALERLNSLQPA